jgi:hypothetical protein
MAGTFDALAWARKLPLTAPEKALMLVLCSYLDENNSCWPSQETLAGDSGMSDRNVRRMFVRWESEGIIERIPRWRTDGRGRTTDRIVVKVGKTLLPDRLSALKSDVLPDNGDVLPDTQGRSYRTRASRELPENSQKRTPRTSSDSEPTICATCGCSTDRPGSYRVKRRDVACLHEVAS